MIKNYFKIAWRNLKKNKLYAFVNLVGLTVGIASCLLIGVYIKHELSYDRFNEKADNIVRVAMEYNFGGAPQKIAVTGTKVGPQFKRTFPQVADFVRTYKRTRIVSYQNQVFSEKGFFYADPSFFKIFSFKLISGDADDVLKENDKIVVTQSTAKKYFGDENPVGKVFKVGDKNLVVSGVAADAPSNSQIQFDFITSFNALDASKQEAYNSANYITYLLLKNNTDVTSLQSQITAYMKRVDRDEMKITGSQYLTFFLEPLTSVHLHSNLGDGFEPNGSITYIYILLVVAVLILIIACVNYINLSIAQSAGRSAEIGIRKVLGAAKKQLFKQFIGESLFVTAIGVILAIGLAFLILPLFNQISGKQFHINVFFDPVIWLCLIVAGSYNRLFCRRLPGATAFRHQTGENFKVWFFFYLRAKRKAYADYFPVCYFRFSNYHYGGHFAAALVYPEQRSGLQQKQCDCFAGGLYHAFEG